MWQFTTRQALQVHPPRGRLAICELINKLISSLLEDRSLVASLQGQGSGHISVHLHFHFHLSSTFYFIWGHLYFHFFIFPPIIVGKKRNPRKPFFFRQNSEKYSKLGKILQRLCFLKNPEKYSENPEKYWWDLKKNCWKNPEYTLKNFKNPENTFEQRN